MNRTRVIAAVMGMLAASVFAGNSPGVTNTYTFDPRQSTVIERFLTSRTYNVTGSFQLTVDSNLALFESVDATLSEKSHSFPQELGELFYMGELVGDVVNDTTIEFGLPPGHPLRQRYDLHITLTYQDEHVRLAGLRFPLMIGEPGFTLEAVASICPAKVIYVDADAIGANDGTSWKDAFNYLQLGMLSASAGDEIRVAQGVYKPHEGIYWDVTDIRSLTFQLINGVTIRGGYAGFGAAEPDARNTKTFETILSGDLNGDDGLEFANNKDNSFHVVTASWTAPSAVLDGFVITGGNASHETIWEHMNGGGFYCDCGSPTVTDCTFRSNYAGNNDGGGSGGAVYFTQGAPSFDRCRFIGNCAIALDGGEGYGGAVYCSTGTCTLNGCVFVDNVSGHDGGAIFSAATSLTIRNCLFSGNLARLGGSGSHGGAVCTWAGNVTIVRCTFSRNTARSDWPEPWTDYGGALFVGESTNLVLLNSILWGNSARHGSQIAMNSYGIGSTDIRYNDVQGGYEGTGNIDVDPLFAGAGKGDYHLKSQAGRWDANEARWTKDEVTSPCIDAGDPMSSIGYEPFPNGGIVNMGAYGGTAEASKSYFGKPPCGTIVAGDINGDCIIDFRDFCIMALHWCEDNNL